MNVYMRNVYHRLSKVHKRFIRTGTKEWLQPTGYETNINIYNPITKCKVPLILKRKNLLTWYTCGPTVYDSAHIGHAATFVKLDIIRRILADHFNINVVMAMSITDIDDKIIKRSQESKVPVNELTKRYENEFFYDMERLNVIKPDLCCRVTDFMPEIIQFVDQILAKNFAYKTKDGSVYFDTNKFSTYGKVSSNYSTESLEPSDVEKKTASDFSLWKGSKQGEPFWESPWGNGRPGWHIECSTIASTVFGNCVDLHSGGIDLIFPHHENEETQSCCYHDVDQWVNYWLHCGHLFLDKIKMSKSLGNTISIQKFLEQYSANEFRMLCLLSHYKNEIRFSDVTMNKAVSLMNKVKHFLCDSENYLAGRWEKCNVDEETLFRCLEETRNTVNFALADDFDTAKAMHSLEQLIEVGNKMMHDFTGQSLNRTAMAAVSNYVSSTFSKLGISHSVSMEDSKMNNLIDNFVEFRRFLRKRALAQTPKDTVVLSVCDEMRTSLSTCGVIIKDHEEKTVWSYNKY